jgi:hypothetical protein
MTLATEIREIATLIRAVSPEVSMQLNRVAVKVGRLELALDEIAEDARESAEIAEIAERAAWGAIKRTGAES